MCVGLVGSIVGIEGEDLDRVATVDVGGRLRRVGLMTVPEAKLGDEVLIHAGFAVRVVG